MIDLKQTKYWTLFGDVWNFAKKNFEVADNDDYWERVTGEAQGLVEKYKGTDQEELARNFTRALMAEIERIQKGEA